VGVRTVQRTRSDGAAERDTGGAGSGGVRSGDAGARPDAPAPSAFDPLVLAALEEDRGPGDLTSEATLAPERRARAELVAKEDGRLAGLGVFARVFELCDPDVEIELAASDGDDVVRGQRLATIAGRARALLLAERTALNFLQRLSGIATATARLVRIAGGRARVLDTRKTTPGLRRLEKYAVRCGGGENHRIGLFDEVMIKDNHIDLSGCAPDELVRRTRARVGPDVRITAEARSAEEALAAARAGADVVLLDNLDVETMRELCPRVRRAAVEAGHTVELEASGGVDEASLAAVAGCGVDRVSVGSLTHSAPALDLSLRILREDGAS